MTRRSELKRREMLGLMAGAGASAMLPTAAWTQGAPAIRKKANLNYWTWSDNPDHQLRLVNIVENFNKSQGFINVVLDASSRATEIPQKIGVAFAAGAAPDVSGLVPANAQDWYKSGILEPIDPFFQKWDEKKDFYPNMVEAMRNKPGQPVLYLAHAMLSLVLYYRADWFEEAKLAPPKTYDEFIAAAKAISAPPNRYGLAMRGADYYGTHAIEPILGSAGVEFVKPDGTVDFDSPAAQKVTEAWVGMLTRDGSAQPTAVTDAYPQLFSLVGSGKCGMWVYGTHGLPQLSQALGERIRAVPTPSAGKRNCTLVNMEGNFILGSSKEKEAASEFIKFIASGDAAISIGPGRGFMPVRDSIANIPMVRENPVLNLVKQNADSWWAPPFYSEHWVNYTSGIPPYWQQLLRKDISVAEYHARGAALLRGRR